MLRTLRIENVAIIEQMELSLDSGLTVLSGETGAGKSILIDAINMLLGGRVSRDLLRTGADRAVVQGVFQAPAGALLLMEELGLPLEEDGTLLIQRSFTDSGKNACRINGALATVAMLRRIGEDLIDIHGQHDNQSLLRAELHITLLDRFAGRELADALDLYRTGLEAMRETERRLHAIAGSDKERERTMDMLRFQIEELEKAGLRPGEDVELERKSVLLANAEDIVSAFAACHTLLHGDDESREATVGAVDAVRRSAALLQRISTLDPAYRDIHAALLESAERLSDLSHEVRDIRDGVEYDPALQQEIEERISLMQGVKRKYGESVEACLAFLKEARTRLRDLENSAERIAALKAEIEVQKAALSKQCVGLNAHRNKAAAVLEKGIHKHLTDLEMPKAVFRVVVDPQTDAPFGEYGTDHVEFMFSANPGEPVKPLARIASGGEMSRVMLAIKSILADTDAIPTLIFDEIDTGVSGKAAQRVGEKLRHLGRSRQVVCVTHHAQIASLADHHHFIGKNQGERTLTYIEPLHGERREAEITRLLAGEHATDTARGLARELLEKGRGTP